MPHDDEQLVSFKGRHSSLVFLLIFSVSSLSSIYHTPAWYINPFSRSPIINFQFNIIHTYTSSPFSSSPTFYYFSSTYPKCVSQSPPSWQSPPPLPTALNSVLQPSLRSFPRRARRRPSPTVSLASFSPASSPPAKMISAAARV